MKLAILYQQSEPPAKDGIKELVKIKEDCVAASQALKIKGLVRIDCREDKNGVFKILVLTRSRISPAVFVRTEKIRIVSP